MRSAAFSGGWGELVGLESVKQELEGLGDDLTRLALILVGPPAVGKSALAAGIARATGRSLYIFEPLPAATRGPQGDGLKSLSLVESARSDATNGERLGSSVLVVEDADRLPGGLAGPVVQCILTAARMDDPSALRYFFSVAIAPERPLVVLTTRAYPPPNLTDRARVVELHGYSHSEKVEIVAQLVGRHHHRAPDHAVLEAAVRAFGFGPGVAELSPIVRAARGIPADELTASRLAELLGPGGRRFLSRIVPTVPGEAIGLGWTVNGGVHIAVEVRIAAGVPDDICIFSDVGDSMRGSAHVALQAVNARISPELRLGSFFGRSIFLNLPSGGYQKRDGQSAGLAFAVAMYGAATGQRTKSLTAFVGELTLRGLVLPVAGVPAKLLLAEREGLESIVLPVDNEPDVVLVARDVRERLRIVYVDSLEDAIAAGIESPS